MNYDTLKTELTADPLGVGYAEMDAQAAADVLNAVNRPQVYSRFLSLRAIAAVLTDEEYGAFKAFLAQASAASPRVADMAAMLAMPCSDSGETGGLDFGEATVRGMVDAFGAATSLPEAAARVKMLAERTISRATELGLPHVEPGHVQDARRL